MRPFSHSLGLKLSWASGVAVSWSPIAGAGAARGANREPAAAVSLAARATVDGSGAPLRPEPPSRSLRLLSH